MEQESLPKGMKKAPQEYAPPVNVDFSGAPVNHSVINYSSLLREAVKEVEKNSKHHGFAVKQLEVIEHESGPAIITLAIEVYQK